MFTLDKGTKPNAENIKQAIEYNEKFKRDFDVLESYYDGEHPILKRAKASKILKNTKVVINHAEYITDLNVGYLLGTPVDYTLSNSEDDKKLEPILEAYKKQTIADLDHELGEDNSIFGVAYEYIYADENADPKSAIIDPRHCVIVYDDTVEHKKLFAVMYGKKSKSVRGGWTNVKVVDNENIYEYSEDLKTVTSTTSHAFGKVPVVKYKNNASERGDFKSVTTLIDAYNIIQSDRINDKQQAVEAILIFYGFKLTDEQKEKVTLNKTVYAPPKVEGTAAEYLQRTLQEADIDVLREKIERDIHKISKTPNLSDENFAGNLSGVAIKFKLVVFEMNAKNKERNFESSLKERFELYNHFLKTKNDSLEVIPLHDLDIVFHRSLPQNDLETAQMLSYVDDIVDDETKLNQLSFIKDASRVLEKKKVEKEEATRLMQEQFASSQQSNNSDDNQL